MDRASWTVSEKQNQKQNCHDPDIRQVISGKEYVKIHRKCHNHESQPSRCRWEKMLDLAVPTTVKESKKSCKHCLKFSLSMHSAALYLHYNLSFILIKIPFELFHRFRLTTLRKQAYSNTLKILPPNMTNFQIKYSDIFHISAQNIDCGYSLEPPRRGGSNEYPQAMLLSRNNKNNVYPCKPQFYYIKVGFKGVKII